MLFGKIGLLWSMIVFSECYGYCTFDVLCSFAFSAIFCFYFVYEMKVKKVDNIFVLTKVGTKGKITIRELISRTIES